MANTVTSQTIQDTDRVAVMKFTFIADGVSGNESAVQKVDVSGLNSHTSSGKSCSGVAIERVWYATAGVSIDVLWDATADVLAWALTGDGYLDFRAAPVTNNSGAGKTGDINFTTAGTDAATNRYSVMLQLRKIYA